MEAAGMYVNIISDKLGTLTVGKKEHEIKETFISTDTVLYDAIYVAGLEGLDPKFKGEIRQFVEDAYKYYKPLIVASDSEPYLDEGRRGEPGVLMLMEDGADKVVDLVTEMRYWERDLTK